MSIRTCMHPNCHAEMPRNKYLCRPHWARLPDEFREEIQRCRTAVEIRELEHRIVEYFESRMIGEHELSVCRGRDCGIDVVWMQAFTRGGKPYRVPVDATQVEIGDIDFDYRKHTDHRDTCPNANDFRRPGR